MGRDFGNFLYELRKEKGWSQAELAEKLGRANRAVSKWETGETMPGTELLAPLAELFGVSVDELLKGRRSDAGRDTTTAPPGGAPDGSLCGAPDSSGAPQSDPSGAPRTSTTHGGSPHVSHVSSPAKRKKLFILIGAAAGAVAVVAIALTIVLIALNGSSGKKPSDTAVYTITYENLNYAGTENPNAFTVFTYTSDTINFAPPTRPGYTGTWDIASIPKGSTGHKTVTAVWTADIYPIAYLNLLDGVNPNAGTTSYTIESDTITLTTPSRTGYTGAWSASSIPKGSTGAVTANALWTPIVYTISYQGLEGAINPNAGRTTYTIETETFAFAVTTRAGYTGTWDIPSVEKGSTGNKTVSAVWTANTYGLTFNYDGATGENVITSKAVAYDSAVGELPAPTKANYDFAGWFTQANGSGTQISAAYVYKLTSDTAVYVKWAVRPATVSFNYQGATGGDGTGSKQAVFGDPIGALPAPQKTGHSFAGWFTAGEGGTRMAADTVVTIEGDFTLYAQWLPFTDLSNFRFTSITLNTAYAIAVASGVTLSGEVVLPDEYDGKPVTMVSQNGFYDNYTTNGYARTFGITSVIIPPSITAISYDAFRDCTGITSIVIPPSVTNIYSGAFRGCSKLADITLPFVGESASATKAAATFGAIFGYVSQTSGSAPAGTTRQYTDYDASPTRDYYYYIPASMKAVTLTGGHTLGSYAFYGCDFLTRMELPSSVVIIRDFAFGSCSSLTEIVMPNVVNIQSSAFTRCYSLTQVTIPASTTEIAGLAFSGCTSMTNINVNPQNTNFTSVDGVLFNKNRATLVSYPRGRGGAYEVPASVTRIETFAFYDCIGLTGVTLPGGLAQIGQSAFRYCFGLTAIRFPASVTQIEAYAFEGCSNVQDIVVPASVTTVGQSAFNPVNSGKGYWGTVYIEGATSRPSGWNSSWNSSRRSVFWGCTLSADKSYVVSFAKTATSVVAESYGTTAPTRAGYTFGGWALAAGSDTAAYTEDNVHQAPNGITLYAIWLNYSSIVEIGGVRYGLNGRQGWRGGAKEDARVIGVNPDAASVTILNTVTLAGASRKVAGIASAVFYNHKKLVNISIPASLSYIEMYAFFGCENLTGITIPSTVTTIDAYAFSNCGALTIYAEPSSRPTNWDTLYWNPSGRPVVWRCTLDAEKTYVESFTKVGGSFATNLVLSAPYRAGCRFVEWNTAADGNGTAYPMATAVEYNAIPSTTTLYAIWASV